MSDLATYQRRLCDLVKERWVPVPGEDQYIDAVAGSPGLAMVREVAAWWRGYAIERTCVLTTRLLAGRGELDAAVAAFTREAAFSDYGDAVGIQFLEYLTRRSEGLVADVAAFEAAYIAQRSDSTIDATFTWSVDPTAVLVALSTAQTPVLVPGVFEVRVGSALPDGFCVSAVKPVA